MADKASVSFQLKALEANLQFVPNVQMVRSMLRAVNTAIPKSLQAEVGSDTLIDKLNKLVKDEANLPSIIDYFSKWAQKTATAIAKKSESDFESRGHSMETIEVTLFGETMKVPEMALKLLDGSKLAEIMKSGPGKEFGTWSDLHKVCNLIRSAVGQIIPEAHRPKRKKRTKKDDDANDESED